MSRVIQCVPASLKDSAVPLPWHTHTHPYTASEACVVMWANPHTVAKQQWKTRLQRQHPRHHRLTPKSGRVDGCCGNQVKCHVRLWWMLLQTVTPAVTTGHIRRRGQETIIFKNFTPSVWYTCSISLHQTDMFCCNPTGLPLAREDGPFFFFGPKQNITPHYPKLVYTPITHHIKITDRFCE